MTNEELMREALEILLFRATQHEGFAAPEANYRAIEAATSALAKSRLNTDDAVDEEVVERVARAICEHVIRKYANKPTGYVERVNAEVDKAWREYEGQARAALSAMGKKS